MITILQIDPKYLEHPNYSVGQQCCVKLLKNNNNYRAFFVDQEIDEQSRLLALQKNLQKLKLSDDEIILFIDPFYAHVVGQDSDMVDKFNSFNADILLGVENISAEPQTSISPSNLRIYNGAMIFRYGALSRLLQVLLALISRPQSKQFSPVTFSNVTVAFDYREDFFRIVNSKNIINVVKKKNILQDKFSAKQPMVWIENPSSDQSYLKQMLDWENHGIKFTGFTDDKMGIYFTNTSSPDKFLLAQVTASTLTGELVYDSGWLNVPYNVQCFVHIDRPDEYIFTLYDKENNISKQIRNNYKQNESDFAQHLDAVFIDSTQKTDQLAK